MKKVKMSLSIIILLVTLAIGCAFCFVSLQNAKKEFAEEEKKLPIAKAPFGIVGLETAFALTVTHLVLEGYLTPMQMVEKMSTNPARILGVEGGTLREGSVADLVIADMNER